MIKTLNKWYFSLVIIPILITYLTNFFSLPKLFEDWKLTIIFSLSILVIILLIELKIVNEILSQPDENDKKIIKKLLKKLNLKSFQEDICTVDSWNGYNQDSIHNITKYQYSARLIENKTLDKNLQKLIENFNDKLADFTAFTAHNVSGNNSGFLVPFKDSNDRDRIKQNCDKMNSLSKIAFHELEILLAYLQSKKYL